MLKKGLRLRQNSTYRKVFAQGKSFSSKYVVIYITDGKPEYGFIASRKIGNAVQRNRAKRLMREVVRLNIDSMPPNKKIIFIARANIKGISYHEAERSIIDCLNRIKNKSI